MRKTLLIPNSHGQNLSINSGIWVNCLNYSKSQIQSITVTSVCLYVGEVPDLSKSVNLFVIILYRVSLKVICFSIAYTLKFVLLFYYLKKKYLQGGELYWVWCTGFIPGNPPETEMALEFVLNYLKGFEVTSHKKRLKPSSPRMSSQPVYYYTYIIWPSVLYPLTEMSLSVNLIIIFLPLAI